MSQCLRQPLVELVQRKWSWEAKMDYCIMCIVQRIHTSLHAMAHFGHAKLAHSSGKTNPKMFVSGFYLSQSVTHKIYAQLTQLILQQRCYRMQWNPSFASCFCALAHCY